MFQSFKQLLADRTLNRQMLRRGVLWTLVVAVILGLGAFFSHREKREIALARARDSFQKDVTTRLWVTQRGGVYVPLDERTQANPYLKDFPNREITTTTGKVYTLVNPAYMTRMLHELGKAEYGLQGHITSLKPIRPENAADAWEQKALHNFEAGSRDYWEELSLAGRPHLRFMGALMTVEGCLRCHASQGYKVGDVRGGISVTVPVEQSSGLIGRIGNWGAFLVGGLLWVLGLWLIRLAGRWKQIRIIERKRLEAENARLVTETYQIQKVESLATMAGSIAHHFNNKLQTVMANLEVMGELPKGADPTRFLALAKQGVEKTAEVSRLMLVYLGQTTLKQELCRLAECCQAALPILQNKMPSTFTLETELPDPGPVVSANADQLQQLLSCLLNNAWEAMGDRAGIVRLSLRTCVATEIATAHRFPFAWQSTQPDYACLTVSDTGCGIAEADIEKLFDPFFSTKFIGRGLGLSVVLGIVQAYGGAITVESSLGEGSVFRLYFPVAAEALANRSEPVFQAPKPEALDTDSRTATGGTILMVDDDEILLEATCALIERLGFTVLPARDGIEALDVFRQHQAEIRCVITDLTMPRLDGWGTLTALRQLDPNLPVVLASGYDKGQALSGNHPDRPQAFLGKPFSLQELRNALGQAMVERKG
jgi:signal transduction histidine kinase/CheY-like chemotaxis protein